MNVNKNVNVNYESAVDENKNHGGDGGGVKKPPGGVGGGADAGNSRNKGKRGIEV